jgi:hypothetical protein
MKKYIKFISWAISLLVVITSLAGCGIFNPPIKDRNGYYISHFESCGPIAMEAAINEYYRRQGIAFAKNPAPRKKISEKIQDDGQFFKGLSSLFDNRTVSITWSWEMKSVAKKYGFKLVSVDDLTKLDPLKDIAFILVRGKFFSSEWHWMCYPVDYNIINFFGSGTKIDKIYLLKKDENSGVLHLGSE